MSQNAYSLDLFFHTPIQLRTAQLLYQYLAAGNTEQAQRWGAELGVTDLNTVWDEDWINHQVSPASTHLALEFETSAHGDMPFGLLETLFAHGLRAAVLEVFYDQVGETERMHFDRGQWVSRQAFYTAQPELRRVSEPSEAAGGPEDDGEDPYDYSKDPDKPISVAALRKQEEKRKREAEEAVKAFLGMASAMGKSGGSPVQGLIGALLVRAGLKGLLHAAVFTLVTVLLFKGFWLWMGLGIALAVALPLYYIVTEHKALTGGDGDDDNDSADGAETVPEVAPR